MKAKKIVSYIFYFFLFCGIFFLENIQVKGIQFTLMWKVPVIIFLTFYVLFEKNKKRSVSFGIYSIILGAEKNLNTSFTYTFTNLVDLMKGINLYLFTKFFLSYFSSGQNLKKILVTVSVYIIISFIPFELGVVSPISNTVDVSVFGGESGIVGIFTSAHNAAISLSIAIFILIYFLRSFSIGLKVWIISLIILGFYFLIFTYTRTGLAALIISVVYYMYSINKGFQIIKLIFILSFIFIPVYFVFKTNESLTNKLIDKRTDSELSVETAGSGRYVIWSINLKHWTELSIEEKIFGVGNERALTYMQSKIGKPFFSHNEFIDVLLINGLLGLILYLFYLVGLIKFIRKKTGGVRNFVSATFVSYLIIMFFQGGHFFLFEMIFALIITYGYQINLNQIKNVT